MGFGNLHYSSMFSPELTCVSQPSFNMGEKAAEMLLNKIDKDYYIPNDKTKSFYRLKSFLEKLHYRFYSEEPF